MRTGLQHGGAMLGVVIALGACGGGGDGGNGNNPTLAIAKATPSGDLQADTIGAPLAQPLRVEVREDGVLSAGKTVAWAVTAGGGQLSAASSQTGLDGVASVSWTLGDQAGLQTVSPTVQGAGGPAVVFSATAAPGNADAISKNAGDLQIALLAQNFPAPVSVEVTDRVGNPKAGVTVDWAVTGGSLVLDAATSGTNGQGIATMLISAGGNPGPGTVTATIQGVPAATTTFTLTVSNASRQVNIGPPVAFTSARNGTTNPAVDTIQAGQTVLWVNNGSLHTVRSQGAPSFTSSGNLNNGSSYTVTFANPGTYQYDCAVHDNAMTGRIVVQ